MAQPFLADSELEARMAAAGMDPEMRARVRMENARRRSQSGGGAFPNIARFAEGVGRGTGGLLDLANMMMPPSVRPSAYLDEGDSFTDMGGREAMAAAGGDPGPAKSALQEITQTALRGAGQAVPTAMAPGGVLLNMAGGAVSEVAARAAEAAGYGKLAQFGASMAGGVLPGMVARVGTPVGSAVLAATSSKIRGRLARKLAAETLGAEIQDRPRAIELLTQEIERPLFGRASTAQVLEPIAPSLFQQETRTAAAGVAGRDLNRELANLRRASTSEAREYAERMFPAGSVGDAVDQYAKQLDEMSQTVRAAYGAAGNLQGIPASRIKAATAKVAIEIGDEGKRLFPQDLLRVISRYGDTVDLKTVERLSQRLNSDYRKLIAQPGTQRERELLSWVKEAADSTLDEVAALGGADDIVALQRARAAAKVKGKLFDPDDPLNIVFGGKATREGRVLLEDLSKPFRAFLNNSPRASNSLNRLRLTLGDNPTAWAGVQRLMRDEIFGADFERIFAKNRLDPRGIDAATKALRRHARAFDVVYGEGASENAKIMLERMHQLTRGNAGTMAMAAPTGMNLADPTEQASAAMAFLSGDRTAALTRMFRAATGRSAKTLAEAQVLFAHALADPEIAKGYLEALPADAVPIWQQRARSALANSYRSSLSSFMGSSE